MKRLLLSLLALRRFLLPLLAVLGAISVFVVAGHSDRPAPPPQVVAPPAVASFPAYIAGSGIIEASSRNIAISTPVGGVVTGIFVQVGSMVKAGDPLFRLDDRDLVAQLQTRRTQPPRRRPASARPRRRSATSASSSGSPRASPTAGRSAPRT